MRCLHESMSSREERAEMKRRRVLMRIERKGEEGALRACVCLCVWAMKRSGETRRGSRCEPESVDPARSHQHWYQINSQTLKLIDLLLRHWWTWWSECCRWRGGFKVSHKPHKTTCFDQGKRGSFRGTLVPLVADPLMRTPSPVWSSTPVSSRTTTTIYTYLTNDNKMHRALRHGSTCKHSRLRIYR